MAVGPGSQGPQSKGPGFMGFLEKIAPFVPVVGGIATNILSGINERKARLYNSPAQQVKRLNEAGLPKAASSNISPGGGVVATTGLGTDQFNNNLSQSIGRQVDRKKLEILQQEERIQRAKANIEEGNAKNLLNPQGVFENTNQGTGAMQTLVQQSEAIKGAQIVNKWMPAEKFQNVMKHSKEIESISQNIKNSVQQHGILISENMIKKSLANYSDSMNMAQLENMISKTTGINKDNILKDIATSIEYQTLKAQVESAQNAALISRNNVEAGKLANILTHMSMPSTEAYYKIRRGMDDATMRKPNLPNTLLYLGMFQPNTSNYNLSNIGAGIHTGLSRWWDATN